MNPRRAPWGARRMGAAVLLALLLTAAAPLPAFADYTVKQAVPFWVCMSSGTYSGTTFLQGLSRADTATVGAPTYIFGSSSIAARAYRVVAGSNTSVTRYAAKLDWSVIPQNATIQSVAMTFQTASMATGQGMMVLSPSLVTTPTAITDSGSVVASFTPSITVPQTLPLARSNTWLFFVDSRDYSSNEQTAGNVTSGSSFMVTYTLPSVGSGGTYGSSAWIAVVAIGGLGAIALTQLRKRTT